MKKNTKAGVILCLSFCLIMNILVPVSGEVKAQGRSAVLGADQEKVKSFSEKSGKSASEMSSYDSQYESQGKLLIEAIEAGDLLGETIETDIEFVSIEDAISFGKYFYRYIYMGRESLILSVKSRAGRNWISVECNDFTKAMQQQRQVEDKLAEIVKAANGMNEKEKATYFYNWVYNNVEYDRSFEKKGVYDAVVDGNSVCWGYVGTYLFLCRSAGMTCEPVYKGNHAWNRVLIDGKWNYCDITWDKDGWEGGGRFLTQQEMDLDVLHKGL